VRAIGPLWRPRTPPSREAIGPAPAPGDHQRTLGICLP
jgi:hypothetical protein